MKKSLLDASCMKKFELAIEYELSHFYLYKLLANKMQQIGYFGAQAYFLKESSEELEHYQKHVDFLNDEGILAKLPDLSPEKDEITSIKDAINVAYENELDLLKYYRGMYKEEAMEYPEIASHLNFFLDTQKDAVGFYGDILAMLETEESNPNINIIIDSKLQNA